jgi:hypothetical protein
MKLEKNGSTSGKRKGMMDSSPDHSLQKADFSVIQLPPDEQFVTLSHAVSWIAFQHSVDAPRLSVALAIGQPRTSADAVQDALLDEAIAKAIKRLVDLGSGSAIEIRGRHFLSVLDDEDEIFTERISPVRLTDFRWFDTLDDSLHRGIGLAWDLGRQELSYPRDTRHFRFVTVSRADLLREFPLRAVSVGQSTGAAESQCQAWLLAKFSEDAEKRKAKSYFRAEALTKFHGTLTERGFNRAWAQVAEKAGRNKAGAKSKR